jgi:hypothetical protein
LNGWYAGNILIGGIVGLLIVDPATGAMYKLGTDAIHETLMPTSSSYVQESPVIQILNISDIPTHWNKYLVSLQN